MGRQGAFKKAGNLLLWFLMALPLEGLFAAEIRIAHHSTTLLSLPLFLAKERGFFRDEGLQPIIVQVQSNIAMMALINGNIDYTSSIATAINAAAQGMPIKTIFANTRDMPHRLLAIPEIQSIGNLRDKIVGVATLSGAEYYVTRAILSHYGLDPDRDVKIRMIGSTSLRLEAMKRGTIQATVLAPPADFMAKKMGFQLLATSVGIVDMPSNGVAATVKKIREYPEEVKRVLRASLRALRWLRERKEETIAFVREKFGLDSETARASYEAMAPIWSEHGRVSEQGVRFVLQLTRERGLIKQEPQLSQILDLRPLEEVLKEEKR